MNAEEAMVSVYDHGFLYGLGLFETFRTYGGQSFLLERHMERLETASQYLGIKLSITLGQLQRIVQSLLEANALVDGYVRVTVSAGTGELGLPTQDYNEPTVVVMVKPIGDPTFEQWRNGKALQLLQTVRNTPEGPYRFKSLHFMNNIIAKRELLALGEATVIGAEGLMLTNNGYIAEGIVSNLFFVKDETIYTPHLDTGILPGITREFVMQLAKQQGFTVEEGRYTFTQLWEASEIWMTNSIQELIPITSLLDAAGHTKQISEGVAGHYCHQLAAAYRATIQRKD